MKKRNRLYYNLVEVTLAMAVVGIGIAGIMALFVPALDASKESIAENYSSQMAGTLLAYVERAKKADWVNSFTASGKPGDAKFTEAIGFNNVGLPDTNSWGAEVLPNLYSLGNNVYGLKLGDGAAFTALARVWAEQVTLKDADDTVSVPNADFIRINVEMSWPAILPYVNRGKRHYVLEMSKPQ